MAISHPLGLLFGFGSNSHGQLGQGQSHESTVNEAVYASQDRIYSNPTVVDYFREKQVLDVACGRSHTLVVCRGRRGVDGEGRSEAVVFSIGLNSSGQCGVGHFNNVYRPTPIILSHHQESPNRDGVSNCSQYRYSVHTGPLSYHSVVVRSCQMVDNPDESFSRTHKHSHMSRTLPAVNSAALEKAVDTWRQTGTPFALTVLRDMIAESFSSIAVLNASFRPVRHADDSEDMSAKTTVRAGIELDLHAVRRAYAVICSTNEEKVRTSSAEYEIRNHSTESLHIGCRC